jgi:hypothetical protein
MMRRQYFRNNKKEILPMLSELPVSSQKSTREEIAIAFGGPALLANRSYVSLTAGGVRVAFAEQPAEGPPVFRAAVSLSFQDAIVLYRVLREAVKKPEAALARAAMERAPSPPPEAAKAN